MSLGRAPVYDRAAVLELVAQGLSCIEVGRRVGASKATVSRIAAAAGRDFLALRGIRCAGCGKAIRGNGEGPIHICAACHPRRTAILRAAAGTPHLRCAHCGGAVRFYAAGARPEGPTYCPAPACERAYQQRRRDHDPEYRRFYRAYAAWRYRKVRDRPAGTAPRIVGGRFVPEGPLPPAAAQRGPA